MDGEAQGYVGRKIWDFRGSGSQSLGVSRLHWDIPTDLHTAQPTSPRPPVPGPSPLSLVTDHAVVVVLAMLFSALSSPGIWLQELGLEQAVVVSLTIPLHPYLLSVPNHRVCCNEMQCNAICRVFGWCKQLSGPPKGESIHIRVNPPVFFVVGLRVIPLALGRGT